MHKNTSCWWFWRGEWSEEKKKRWWQEMWRKGCVLHLQTSMFVSICQRAFHSIRFFFCQLFWSLMNELTHDFTFTFSTNSIRFSPKWLTSTLIKSKWMIYTSVITRWTNLCSDQGSLTFTMLEEGRITCQLAYFNREWVHTKCCFYIYILAI